MPVRAPYPSVYIQEVSGGVNTIAGVATSIAAFFGRTTRGPVNKAVRCASYSDFLREFADGHPKSDLKNSVKQFFDNGGSDCFVVRIAQGAVKADVMLKNAATPPRNILRVQAKNAGAWGNNIRVRVTSNSDGKTFNLKVFEVAKDGTTVASEAIYTNLSMNRASSRYVVNFVTKRSNLVNIKLINPAFTTFTSATNPQPATYALGNTADGAGKTGLDDGNNLTTAAYSGIAASHTGFYALDKVDLFNLMVIPGDSDVTDYQPLFGPASNYCQQKRAFLLMDAPANWTSGVTMSVGAAEVNALCAGVSKQNAAVFYPRVKFSDAGLIKTIGVSGIIAGLMARTDSQRGVWKAPAGIEADLRGVLDVELNLTDLQNGVLNKLAVNCIRKFPNGIVNWGARTLDGADEFGSEWKYISVRRLALFLEESLYRGTKWVIFEPNDEPLWAKIRMNVTAFMMDLFRQGAFQGNTPGKAFFVKCDAETTTQNDRNRGIVNIQVGFAPLKPAEFVIIKIQQIAGDSV